MTNILGSSENALLELVQRGEVPAFDELVTPYRSELLVYCYRLIGSLHDAEDAVQDTLLRAWKSIHTFQRRQSFRAWLYKIATNVCLTALSRFRRRPAIVGMLGDQRLIEPSWIEPFPDHLLVDNDVNNPEAIYSRRESVTLAFVVALQLLPAKQRAALVLHDVLDWQAAEIAEFLTTSVSAVNSLLHRARVTLSNQYRGERVADPAPAFDPSTQALLNRYVRAWEDADAGLLAAILKEDALFTMPPAPEWFQGREAICAFVLKDLFRGTGAGFGRALAVQANAQPAYALYRRDSDHHGYRAFGISVLTISRDTIASIATFLGEGLFPRFHLPIELSSYTEDNSIDQTVR